MKLIQAPSRFLLLVFILGFYSANAQTDSLAFVSAKWQKKKIKRGIVWKQHHFKGNLFSSNQCINILEVKRSRKNIFSIAFEPKVLKPTSEFGKEAGAIAALNGTFFDMKEGGSVDFIKVRNTVVNENQLRKNGRASHQKAAVTIERGQVKIEKWNGSPDWESSLAVDEIMVSGPLLMFDSQAESLDSASFNVTRHPRTLVAISPSNKVMLITIDGRHENSAGMNLFELQAMLRWMGARHGINLDGGGSTTLWIYNQPDNGVVNYPSDNKKWDHAGERKVANVILLKRK